MAVTRQSLCTIVWRILFEGLPVELSLCPLQVHPASKEFSASSQAKHESTERKALSEAAAPTQRSPRKQASNQPATVIDTRKSLDSSSQGPGTARRRPVQLQKAFVKPLKRLVQVIRSRHHLRLWTRSQGSLSSSDLQAFCEIVLLLRWGWHSCVILPS